jgi:ketosteroid isomerase-like protein
MRSSQWTRRRAYGWTIAAAFAVPLCAHSLQSGMPRAQKHQTRLEIDRLEEQWRSAILSSSVPALNSLLADDYMAITSFGTLETKDQTLAGLRSGAMHFTTLNISDRKVRFYGHTALVTSRAEVRGTIPEGSVNGSFRYTHVYIRNARGAWKIVSFEASRIRGPGERRAGNDRRTPRSPTSRWR